MRRSLQHWTESFIIPNPKERSVWRNKKPQKRTVSFVEDRSLTWSTSTSGSLELMILSRIMPTYLQLFFEMMIFRNSIQGGTAFYHRESEKVKTVLELYNMEIHQKKAGLDYHRLKTMVKRSMEQNLRVKNFEARNGNYERNAVVKNQRTKQREQRTLRDCWQWNANGQCSKGDNCSFRHDMNKRSKSTQSNPSPSSSTRQNERNASRTRGPRGKSPSGGVFRLPCKDYHKGTRTNSSVKKGILHNACSFGRRMDEDLVKSALIAHRQVEEQPSNRSKKNGDMQWLCWKLHANWVAYSRIWSRRSLHRFCGRARTYWNQSDVFDSLKSWYVMLTFETRIHRSEWFTQVNLISVTSMLQNLRIGPRKRRNGKSDVPVKQRGGWPKIS